MIHKLDLKKCLSDSATRDTRRNTSGLARPNCFVSWNENKENRFPAHRGGCRKFGSSFSQIVDHVDDETSGDSPDLGIGSDEQFSSIEKLNAELTIISAKDRISNLCSDSSKFNFMDTIEFVGKYK